MRFLRLQLIIPVLMLIFCVSAANAQILATNSSCGDCGGITPGAEETPPPQPPVPEAPPVFSKAKLINKNLAVAPASAPETIKKMIQAGNTIRHRPYIYGGGHASFDDQGYDCSGSVSYLLHAGGFLDVPQTSGALADFGEPGAGKWVTIYANAGHAFMVVAGLRFDTSYITDGDSSGPGWSKAMRPKDSYIVRHIDP